MQVMMAANIPAMPERLLCEPLKKTVAPNNALAMTVMVQKSVMLSGLFLVGILLVIFISFLFVFSVVFMLCVFC